MGNIRSITAAGLADPQPLWFIIFFNILQGPTLKHAFMSFAPTKIVDMWMLLTYIKKSIRGLPQKITKGIRFEKKSLEKNLFYQLSNFLFKFIKERYDNHLNW